MTSVLKMRSWFLIVLVTKNCSAHRNIHMARNLLKKNNVLWVNKHSFLLLTLFLYPTECARKLTSRESLIFQSALLIASARKPLSIAMSHAKHAHTFNINFVQLTCFGKLLAMLLHKSHNAHQMKKTISPSRKDRLEKHEPTAQRIVWKSRARWVYM